MDLKSNTFGDSNMSIFTSKRFEFTKSYEFDMKLPIGRLKRTTSQNRARSALVTMNIILSMYVYHSRGSPGGATTGL